MGTDQVRVSVRVDVPIDAAFRMFTTEIDQWWRRGPAFRGGKGDRGILHLEPFVGGRLFESIDRQGRDPLILQTGTVTEWSPPNRLTLEWRNLNFTRSDASTRVVVEFHEQGQRTQVTVTHSGWDAIRPDHPARHGHDAVAFCRMLGTWWGQLMSALRVHMLK